MSWAETAALAALVLAGLYLLALGVTALLMPQTASRFLLGFARTRRVHFTEMIIRMVVGAAFVVYAPRMSASGAFQLFGWTLMTTTACLAMVPWHWHYRFAQQAVPLFTRYVSLLGLVSLGLGGCVFAGIFR